VCLPPRGHGFEAVDRLADVRGDAEGEDGAETGSDRARVFAQENGGHQEQQSDDATAQVAVCVAELFNPTLCSATSDVLRLSQEEIARLCGLSRQITNRALHELQEAGFVRIQYGSINVLDIEGLHAFGRGAELRQGAPRPVAVVTRPH
jgi:CRP-like cAMP-binding protein